jgi:hypothetical protein
VPPLLATVGKNGKVSFLEKGGTSEFQNSTGAYELDLSLVDDFDHAWREMHVKTDVFCSGAVVLPDKAARILNVGGWSLTSTFGIRLYAPDGSPGVNGTNDWEEDPDTLQLQVRVAYPRPYHVYSIGAQRVRRTGWTLVSDRTCSVQWQCPYYGRRDRRKRPSQPNA